MVDGSDQFDDAAFESVLEWDNECVDLMN